MSESVEVKGYNGCAQSYLTRNHLRPVPRHSLCPILTTERNRMGSPSSCWCLFRPDGLAIRLSWGHSEITSRRGKGETEDEMSRHVYCHAQWKKCLLWRDIKRTDRTDLPTPGKTYRLWQACDHQVASPQSTYFRLDTGHSLVGRLLDATVTIDRVVPEATYPTVRSSLDPKLGPLGHLGHL